MRTFNVEKDWLTAAGYRAVVIMGDLGHRCGYVAIPAGHPLHGVDYSAESEALAKIPDDEPLGKRSAIALLCCAAEGRIKQSPEMAFNVHGGLSYSGGNAGYPVPSSGLWWFGFDCGHAGDAQSPEYIAKQRAEYPDKPYMWRDYGGEHRTLDYCVDECESLARQIVEKTVTA